MKCKKERESGTIVGREKAVKEGTGWDRVKGKKENRERLKEEFCVVVFFFC